MKNKEKYANEIIELAIQGLRFGVDKQSNRVAPCNSIRCNSIRCVDCLFHGVSSCSQKTFEWANAEYKEPKKFTDREIEFIKLFPEIKYLARNRYGDLLGYTDKPFKDEEQGWWACKDDSDILFDISFSFGDLLKFNSIQWDDEEPTSREEILEEEQ